MNRGGIAPALVTATLGLAMLAGPSAHLFDGRVVRWSPPWRMFEAVGRDHCALELWKPTPHGRFVLDRYAPFGGEGFWDAPMEVRWISNREHAESLVHALCERQVNPTIDYRLRCPEPDGRFALVAEAQVRCESAAVLSSRASAGG